MLKMAEVTGPEKKKRGVKANKAQLEELVAYMVQHPGLSRGAQLGYDGARTKEDMWDELTNKLDYLGGHKEPDSWLVTWRDLKSKASRKAAALRRAKVAKGGLPNPIKALTQQELAILSTMDKCYYEGMQVSDGLVETDDAQISLRNGASVESILVQDINATGEEEWESYTIELEAGPSREPYSNNDVVPVLLPSAETSSTTNSSADPNPTSVEGNTKSVVQSTSSPVPSPSPSTTKSTSSKSSLRRTPLKRPRLGTQIAEARDSFKSIAASQAETMRILAEPASRQADAAIMQAENERRRLDMQERLESPLLATLKDISSFLRCPNGTSN